MNPFKMTLHSETTLENGTQILRVPGGWIYNGSVFVPEHPPMMTINAGGLNAAAHAAEYLSYEARAVRQFKEALGTYRRLERDELTSLHTVLDDLNLDDEHLESVFIDPECSDQMRQAQEVILEELTALPEKTRRERLSVCDPGYQPRLLFEKPYDWHTNA